MTWIYDAVGAYGLHLAVAAWLTLAVASLGLGALLWRCELGGSERRWALGVGALALGCHLPDLLFSLGASHQLTQEASALWVAVFSALGHPAAVAYGVTGKLMLALVSYELFALYLVQRRGLFPSADTPASFRAFWAAYGAGPGLGPQRLLSWFSLFAFLFPLVAPVMLYLSVLNAAADSALGPLLLPWPIASVLWVALVAVAWAVVTWKAWLRWRESARS